LQFAVVDIETTGLFHQGHGITEVSVVLVEKGTIKPLYNRLFNPGREVPASIEAITGISTKMISGAPPIEDSIDELAEILKDKIFVAHNVNFDYQFLKAVFDKSDKPFRYKRLCTLRYARKVFPKFTSHRLGELCRKLGIVNKAEHRALGDAMATSELLLQLLEKDQDAIILKKLLGRGEHHLVLPANLDEQEVLDLPDLPGVYYMYGVEPKPIYIGKAKSLKKRVISHFTSSGSTRRKQLFQRQVHRLEYRVTDSEYHALLLEDAEIKKHWPRYNQAQKERTKAIAVVPYTDRSGKKRLAFVNKPITELDVLAWFNSLHTAKSWLYKAFIEFGINPQRAGLPLSEEFELLEDQEEADAFEAFVQRCFSEKSRSFALIEATSKRYALIKEGRYRGYGKMSEKPNQNLEYFENKLEAAPDSSAARAVIRNMLADDRIKKIQF
jgi:DNA polymerase-3 subunit epsilon